MPAWHERLASRRPPHGRLALPRLLPALASLCLIAPGATRKAHEAASSHRDPQAPLVVRAVEGAQGRWRGKPFLEVKRHDPTWTRA